MTSTTPTSEIRVETVSISFSSVSSPKFPESNLESVEIELELSGEDMNE